MGYTINALKNFKVDPSVVGVLGDIIFIYKLLGNFSKLDIGILRVVKRGAEVEVFNIKSP